MNAFRKKIDDLIISLVNINKELQELKMLEAHNQEELYAVTEVIAKAKIVAQDYWNDSKSMEDSLDNLYQTIQNYEKAALDG